MACRYHNNGTCKKIGSCEYDSNGINSDKLKLNSLNIDLTHCPYYKKLNPSGCFSTIMIVISFIIGFSFIVVQLVP